ncbi:hypothetical protein KIP88_07255 [Bradyrhizobium sp. SRL28]|jgi:hypothetical protein|uniref:hypothetical protein n=1 Tax=Bradyrhizobium sp. SRL28 TaxID=2836178 RepID=UPI001BDE436B|nr:hypothetical protein [Bradyrhizobium sp. SRL28]MBT1510297.1 hypothetical protein [Bradyrhizobium sp. SRL28]
MTSSDSGVESHVSAAFSRENVAFHGNENEVLAIAAKGPRGAALVAALSVAALLAIWIAFYFFIFVPRGDVG